MIEKKIWQTREWLEEHYYNQRLSFKQIAKIVGRSDIRVGQVARELGITVRSVGEEASKEVDWLLKDDSLVDLYVNQKLTAQEIGKRLGVSFGTVLRFLRLRGIDTRTRSESRYEKLCAKKGVVLDTETLRQQYESGESLPHIAKSLGWSYGAVRRKLAAAGVRFRDDREAAILRSPQISKTVKEWWTKDSNRQRMLDVFDARPKVSTIQQLLYDILDDLGVHFFRERNDGLDDSECKIGFWSWDCVIPRSNRPTLVIEVNGSYTHSRRDAVIRDKRKSDYLANKPEYELKYIWEHDFGSPGKVYGLLKYWLGLNDVINVDFGSIEVKLAARPECRSFLDKYHYLGYLGPRSTKFFGAYYDGELIAVAGFSSPIRQNVSIEGYKWSDILEYSRLCIHPRFQCKNLASWFTARCIRLLPVTCKAIIAYADTAVGHTGAVYSACNFKKVSTTQPDYWYIDKSGFRLHKKTLYNHARFANMTESDFAEKFGYKRVFGSGKHKFVYHRRLPQRRTSNH